MLTNWVWLGRLWKRARRFVGVRVARCLRLCAPFLAEKPRWRPWSHLVVLTVAGVCSSSRARIALARRLAGILGASELLDLCVRLAEEGRSAAYVATVMRAKPGDLWARQRYPLAVSCGEDDEPRRVQVSALLVQAAAATQRGPAAEVPWLRLAALRRMEWAAASAAEPGRLRAALLEPRPVRAECGDRAFAADATGRQGPEPEGSVG